MPTSDGGRIATGRLLRSDNLQDLTPADVEVLRARGVTDVVDLRADAEAAAAGPGPLTRESWVRIRQLSLFDEGGARARPETSAPQPGPEPVETTTDPAAIDRALVPSAVEQGVDDTDIEPWGPPAAHHYVAYLLDRPDSMVAALRTIAEAEGAALVHCAAGKDRTGTVVAVALLLAGADREAIIADYAASAERIELIMERLLHDPVYVRGLRGQTADSQRPDARVIAGVLDHIAPAGDLGPLLDLLAADGWTDADTARLRAHLRE